MPELYVTTAVDCALPACLLPDDRPIGWSCAGLPLPSDLSKRVRRMYSLRQEAKALRRANDRLAESWISCPSMQLPRTPTRPSSSSAPGKYRAKAILQACGVVTKL